MPSDCKRAGCKAYVSRFTFHVSRFTFYVLRFTFHVSRLASSLQKKRHTPHCRRHRPDQHHRLRPAEAAADQPVREVVRVADVKRSAHPPAAPPAPATASILPAAGDVSASGNAEEWRAPQAGSR